MDFGPRTKYFVPDNLDFVCADGRGKSVRMLRNANNNVKPMQDFDHLTIRDPRVHAELNLQMRYSLTLTEDKMVKVVMCTTRGRPLVI